MPNASEKLSIATDSAERAEMTREGLRPS